jgi:hypothetical protein
MYFKTALSCDVVRLLARPAALTLQHVTPTTALSHLMLIDCHLPIDSRVNNCNIICGGQFATGHKE